MRNGHYDHITMAGLIWIGKYLRGHSCHRKCSQRLSGALQNVGRLSLPGPQPLSFHAFWAIPNSPQKMAATTQRILAGHIMGASSSTILRSRSLASRVVETETPFHGLNHAINRGVSPEDILSTVSTASVVLEQGVGRNYLYRYLRCNTRTERKSDYDVPRNQSAELM
jgi:hypothetical protein